jgi:hypothetical protein
MAARLKRTMSSEEAGAMLGISVSQMRRIAAKAQRDAAMPAWTAGLDIRTANVLLAAGLTGKDQVREAIEQGREIAWLKEVRREIVRKWLGQ